MLTIVWMILFAFLFVLWMYRLDVRSGKKYAVAKAVALIVVMIVAFIYGIVANLKPRGANASGLAALSEFQKQSIYRAISEPAKEKQEYEKIITDNRKLASDVAAIERYIATLENHIEREIDIACRRYKLTRSEVQQIVGIPLMPTTPKAKEPPASSSDSSPEPAR